MSPNQKKKVDLSDFLGDIDDKSVEASLEAGEILPQLKLEVNQVATVKVLGNLRSFKSDYGITYCIDVLYNNMKHNLIIPKSLKFQLIVAMKRKGLVDKEGIIDIEQLNGKNIVVKKSIGDTKQYKDAKLYSVEIL